VDHRCGLICLGHEDILDNGRLIAGRLLFSYLIHRDFP
jgi:hypothetical protein